MNSTLKAWQSSWCPAVELQASQVSTFSLTFSFPPTFFRGHVIQGQVVLDLVSGEEAEAERASVFVWTPKVAYGGCARTQGVKR